MLTQIHYDDIIMGMKASQITSLTIIYSVIYSGADQRKHQSSASLALCVGNSPVTGEFPTQMASNTENVSIWWRHHAMSSFGMTTPHWVKGKIVHVNLTWFGLVPWSAAGLPTQSSQSTTGTIHLWKWNYRPVNGRWPLYAEHSTGTQQISTKHDSDGINIA